MILYNIAEKIKYIPVIIKYIEMGLILWDIIFISGYVNLIISILVSIDLFLNNYLSFPKSNNNILVNIYGSMIRVRVAYNKYPWIKRMSHCPYSTVLMIYCIFFAESMDSYDAVQSARIWLLYQ